MASRSHRTPVVCVYSIREYSLFLRQYSILYLLFISFFVLDSICIEAEWKDLFMCKMDCRRKKRYSRNVGCLHFSYFLNDILNKNTKNKQSLQTIYWFVFLVDKQPMLTASLQTFNRINGVRCINTRIRPLGFIRADLHHGICSVMLQRWVVTAFFSHGEFQLKVIQDQRT